MNKSTNLTVRAIFLSLFCSALLACGGGGGGGGGGGEPTPAPAPNPTPSPAPTPEPLSAPEAARMLSQATFGPTSSDIAALVEDGAEAWFLAELDKPASLHLDDVLAGFPADGNFLDEQGVPVDEIIFLANDSVWQTSIEADDQLRQRMAFALSQILVVSAEGNLGRLPQIIASYVDVLTRGAFGNYRDLLEEVTYSPAMAIYLTYLRNEKADPISGRVPDENYARELLQLFTVGLVELNPDGTPVLAGGEPVELFDNDDITGLAKVFTGLSFTGIPFRARLRQITLEASYQPLDMFDAFHSTEEKTFLGTTIPAGTGGRDSIDAALDAIFAHPNVGPFIGRQLIQRFVTSAPEEAYVARVSAAFDAGEYTLPSGTRVGSGVRGDLAATLAAILFDEQARDAAATGQNSEFGKLREPVLRFTHWARAFEVNSADASNELALRNTAPPDRLGQHPYRSPSVFNFYRPGYIAPGTSTGDAGLTAPELQIVNASSIIGYANFLSAYLLGATPQVDRNAPRAFVSDYDAEVALEEDVAALLDHLDLLLTHGELQAETRARITEALEVIPAASAEDRQNRVRLAILMVMTSPEYIVLR